MHLRPAAEIVRRGLAFCFAQRAFWAKLILRRAAADKVCCRDEPLEPKLGAINRFLRTKIELQIERRMRFRFSEDEPRQQTDTHQHTAKSRCKCQRVRRPHACHEPPAEHRCEVSQ